MCEDAFRDETCSSVASRSLFLEHAVKKIDTSFYLLTSPFRLGRAKLYIK